VSASEYDLVIEFLKRHSAGETVSIEDFLAKHPGTDHKLVKPILTKALQWPAADKTDTIRQRLEESGFLDPNDLENTLVTPWTGGNGKEFEHRYNRRSVLGEGGYGKVYLVEDRMHGSELLALKVIRKVHTTGDLEQRFRNEIRVLRTLSHPAIPMIFNDGKNDEGEIYYTMSYIEGRTLDEIIRDEAPLNAERILNFSLQLVEVLVYAHEKGIVHRDLKPSNIIITADDDEGGETVKVLDFGIAKVLRHEGLLEQAQTMGTEVPLGTPHYMAPEQVRGQVEDGRTDLYALGIIIYQMCSGRLPFEGQTSMEVLIARLENSPRALTSDEAPQWLRDLVGDFLERDKSKRPSTSAALETLRAADTSPRVGRGKRLVGALVVASVLAALVLGSVFYGGGAPGPEGVLAGAHGDSTKDGGDSGPSKAGVLGEPSPTLGDEDAPPAPVPPKTAPDDNGTRVPTKEPPGEPDDDEPPPEKPKPEKVPAVVTRTRPTIKVVSPAWLQGVASEDPVHRDTAQFSVTFEGWSTEHCKLLLAEQGGQSERDLVVQPNESCDVQLPREGEWVLQLYEDSEAPQELDGPLFEFVVVFDATEPVAAPHIEGLTDNVLANPTLSFTGLAQDEAPGLLDTLSFQLRHEDGDWSEPSTLTLADGEFGSTLALAGGDGEYEVRCTAVDRAGNAGSSTVSFALDTTPPTFKLAETPGATPEAPATTLESSWIIAGTVLDAHVGVLEIDGEKQVLDENAFFTGTFPLEIGRNTFELVVRDTVGYTEVYELEIVRAYGPKPKGYVPAGPVEGGWFQTIRHEATGMELVYVKAASPDLPAFYIGKYEVTWREYEHYYPESQRPDWEVTLEHPVVNVTYADARALSQAVGGRLPTVEEWVHAARKNEEAYPWGDDWRDRVCSAERGKDPYVYATEVGSFDDDQSWCGAYDMAGNVREICIKNEDSGSTAGGSWNDPTEDCRAERSAPLARVADFIGFRVVVDTWE
jgi:predicted Ser/Thr protein kinase